MAHTPGPWTAHEQQSKFGTLEGYYVVENGRVQIADLFGIVKGERDEDGNEVFISTDEAAANARLIAAAPDLLDACKTILQAFWDGELEFTKKRQSDSDPYHPANAKLVAAIAKAQGGA